MDDLNTTFAELGINESILKTLNKIGYNEPTKIQQATIPNLLEGKDVIGIAQTGTGKTAAFGIPLIQAIEENGGIGNDTIGIILSPTRELAIQSSDSLKQIASGSLKDCGGVKIATIYGGAGYTTQLKDLKAHPHIVVATPGRLIDMMDRKAIDLSKIEFAVLDEADEMLKMGFADDVSKILESSDSQIRQTALFSATMPAAIKKIANKYMNDPVTIQVDAAMSTVEAITQQYVIVPAAQKTSAVHKLILSSPAKGIVIFTRTRRSTDAVADELQSLGVNVAAINGDVAQNKREQIVKNIKNQRIRVLVATDVAARGLDIDHLDLVINYDLPDETEIYVHRVGRTGRIGRDGKAISLLTPREQHKLAQIEKLTNQSLEEINIPSAVESNLALAEDFVHRAAIRLKKGHLAHYSSIIEREIAETEDPEEVLRFMSGLLAEAIGDRGDIYDSENKHKPAKFEKGNFSSGSGKGRRAQKRSGETDGGRNWSKGGSRGGKSGQKGGFGKPRGKEDSRGGRGGKSGDSKSSGRSWSKGYGGSKKGKAGGNKRYGK